jgi:hypothetical protein
MGTAVGTINPEEAQMPTVTTQYRMFVPRRRRIGGGGATVDILPSTPNFVSGDYTADAPGGIEVHYPLHESPPRTATFMFWSVRGSANGEYTQADAWLDAPTNGDPMTATAWYCLPGEGGGEGEVELETDAFLVNKEEFVEPTPIESVAPASAWDHSDVDEFVFTTDAAEVLALDSVVDPSEHFERWYSLEGDATASGKKLEVPAEDGGIAIATYRIPPSSSPRRPGGYGSIVGQVVGGTAVDGEGGIIINGVFHRIEPWSPFLAGIAVYEAAGGLPEKARIAVQSEALRAISGYAGELGEHLGGGAQTERE